MRAAGEELQVTQSGVDYTDLRLLDSVGIYNESKSLGAS
jgi:hypothetical protein